MKYILIFIVFLYLISIFIILYLILPHDIRSVFPSFINEDAIKIFLPVIAILISTTTIFFQYMKMKYDKIHSLIMEKNNLTFELMKEWDSIDGGVGRDNFIDKLIFLSENSEDKFDKDIIKKYITNKDNYKDDTTICSDYSYYLGVVLPQLLHNHEINPDQAEYEEEKIKKRIDFLS